MSILFHKHIKNTFPQCHVIIISGYFVNVSSYWHFAVDILILCKYIRKYFYKFQHSWHVAWHFAVTLLSFVIILRNTNSVTSSHLCQFLSTVRVVAGPWHKPFVKFFITYFTVIEWFSLIRFVIVSLFVSKYFLQYSKFMVNIKSLQILKIIFMILWKDRKK